MVMNTWQQGVSQVHRYMSECILIYKCTQMER